MLVQDYMTAPALVVRPETHIVDALQFMHEHRIRRLPVVNQTQWLVGIVSERDLLYASPSPVTMRKLRELSSQVAETAVQEIMTKRVIVVRPDAKLAEAASLMIESKIGGLPVMDEHREVVGIITETDIMRVLVELLQRPANMAEAHVG